MSHQNLFLSPKALTGAKKTKRIYQRIYRITKYLAFSTTENRE